MGRRRSAQDADLERLYAQVPDAGCKGLCAAACGPIDMSPREASRLREVGVEIAPTSHATSLEHARHGLPCPALTEAGRCSVYDRRPMVCRLWGATEALRCPHGCMPAEGLLPDVEGVALIIEAARVGGAPAEAQRADRAIARTRRDPNWQRTLSTYIAVTANQGEL